MVAENDIVCYLGEINGTQNGELFGQAPSGNGMRVLGINFFRFEDGQIIERWGQFDVLSMMQQLGLAPVAHRVGAARAATDRGHVARRADVNSIEETKAVYTRFVDEVINGGNVDVVEELFAPDYVDHTAPPGAPPGLDAVRMIPTIFRGGFPDVHFTIEKLVGEGDIVASHVTGHGTHTGQFLAFPASGNEATWRSLGFFRVRDGKIVEHWGLPDMLGLLIQIGVIPPPETGSGDVIERLTARRSGSRAAHRLPDRQTRARFDEMARRRAHREAGVDTREVIETYYRAATAGDWDTWLDLFAEDVVMDEQLAGHVEGKDFLREVVEAIKTGYEKFENVPKHIVVEGNRAAAHTHISARSQGIDVEADASNYFELRDGKIVYSANIHDTVPFQPFLNQG